MYPAAVLVTGLRIIEAYCLDRRCCEVFRNLRCIIHVHGNGCVSGVLHRYLIGNEIATEESKFMGIFWPERRLHALFSIV